MLGLILWIVWLRVRYLTSGIIVIGYVSFKCRKARTLWVWGWSYIKGRGIKTHAQGFQKKVTPWVMISDERLRKDPKNSHLVGELSRLICSKAENYSTKISSWCLTIFCHPIASARRRAKKLWATYLGVTNRQTARSLSSVPRFETVAFLILPLSLGRCSDSVIF